MEACVSLTMLTKVLMLNVSTLKRQPMQKTATGMSAFSIWMKETDRNMYAEFPSHRVPSGSTTTLAA